MLWMCGFFIRDLLPVSRRTEKFGTQFLSLLQCRPCRIVSANSVTAEKPNCRRHLRVRLGSR
jgi:hypothetical protein